jgi:hypothetical protein
MMLKEEYMKPVIRNILALSLFSASSAIAASGAESDGNGLLLSMFIGFAVVIVAFQFLPGILMFLGMTKGIFSSRKSEVGTSKS